MHGGGDWILHDFAWRPLAWDRSFLCGPAAALDAPVAPHPVAYGQDHIQAVEADKPLYPAAALGLNYQELPNSCLGALLVIAVNSGDMLTIPMTYGLPSARKTGMDAIFAI